MVFVDAPYFEILSTPWSNTDRGDHTLRVANGNMADLSFQVKAVPKPHYEWYNRSEKMVYDNSGNGTRWRISGSEFWIWKASRFDSGNFTLKIISPDRIRYKTIQLHVESECFI